jgi:hypothetical protein
MWHAFSPFSRALCGKRASEHRIEIEMETQRDQTTPA